MKDLDEDYPDFLKQLTDHAVKTIDAQKGKKGKGKNKGKAGWDADKTDKGDEQQKEAEQEKEEDQRKEKSHRKRKDQRKRCTTKGKRQSAQICVPRCPIHTGECTGKECTGKLGTGTRTRKRDPIPIPLPSSEHLERGY